MQVNTGVLHFDVNQEPRLTRVPSPGSPLDNGAYDQQTREGSELGRVAGVFRRCPEMIELHRLLVELLSETSSSAGSPRLPFGVLIHCLSS